MGANHVTGPNMVPLPNELGDQMANLNIGKERPQRSVPGRIALSEGLDRIPAHSASSASDPLLPFVRIEDSRFFLIRSDHAGIMKKRSNDKNVCLHCGQFRQHGCIDIAVAK